MNLPNQPEGDITTAAPSLSAATLAGLLGTELLAPLSAMQAVVDTYAETRNLSLEQAQELQRAIHVAHSLAQRSQRLGLVLSQPPTRTHQLLRLDEHLHETLAVYADLCDEMGVNVRSNIKPVNVVTDPDLLKELIRSVIEWAMESGQAISFLAKPAGDPEHPVLAATVIQQPDAGSPDERRAAQNTLGWQHLNQVAHRMSASVTRESAPQGHVLVIDFPPLPDDAEVLLLEGADRKPWWGEA